MLLLYISIKILLIILSVLAFVALIFLLKQLFHVKVWIDSRFREDQPFIRVGYLEKPEEGKAAEVHQASSHGKPAIGMVMTDEKSTRNNAYVDMLMSDINDDAQKPHYRRTGYLVFDHDTTVDEFGYVYKQITGSKKKEIVGYLARPSQPDVPTIYGERTWRTLWLKCTLNAYAGLPPVPAEAQDAATSAEPAAPIEHLCINADAGENLPEDEVLPEEAPVEEAPVEEAAVEEAAVEEAPVEEAAVEEAAVEEAVVEEAAVEEAVVEEAPVEEVPAEEPKVDPFAALTDTEKARLDQVRSTYPQLLKEVIGNMVKVEGGTFTMGDDPQPDDVVDSTDGKARGMVENNESPKHQVTLTTYYISRYPVTQALWKAVMGNNPSECQDDPNYPVAPVNWYDSNDFILRLSYVTGVMFHMPTEAQWEFAARGGLKTKNHKFAGSDTFSEVGWNDYKHPVGAKKANELGIYDMSGLVREWCSDLWGHYSEEAQTDPVGPAEDSPLIILNPEGKTFRAVRSPSGNETVTNRKGEIPELDKEFKSYGLRIAAFELPEKQQEEAKEAVPVKPLEKTAPRKPLAVCSYWGFHNSKKDYLPAEARAGAFALLQRFSPRQRQAEYASDQPYGWRDTALLSACIYTVIYLIAYLVNTGILQMPVIGPSWWSVLVVVMYYFILWAIVRFIKIDAIENSNSFQPILDLFNKNLGMRGMNITILVMAFVVVLIFAILPSIAWEFMLTRSSFPIDYTLLPVAIVIAIGVAVNMTLSAANRRWKVLATFLDDEETEEEEGDDSEPKNPEGDISRSYDWDLDPTYKSEKKVHGNLTLYFTASDMKDLRHLNPFFSQRKEFSDKDNILSMFHFLKKYKKTFLARTNYIAYVINNLSAKNQFSPLDKIQFTLDFVQEPNVVFQENCESKVLNYYDDYIRYPDETLYDKTGDCNSKSLLAAMLFHLMGYNVLYLMSRKHQHAAIGVEVRLKDLTDGWYGDAEKTEDITIKYEGRYFIFCETTGDRFSIGAKVAGMSLDEFDEKVFLPVREDADEETEQDEDETDDMVSRIYVWDLDSEYGNKLQGHLALEFSAEAINNLRRINPFVTYGKDGNTYQSNVASIFDYLKKDPSRMAAVRQVAEYVRDSVKAAGFPELDMLQFALDFAQAPNITYQIDEKSAGIEYAKEYMRFPDEVLFDKEGDCDCKSSLAAALFLSLGYDVIFMLSEKLQHAAIGIECKEEWLVMLKNDNPENVLREHNGKRYLYCETTGDGFRVGHIKDNESIQDFETIVELKA